MCPTRRTQTQCVCAMRSRGRSCSAVLCAFDEGNVGKKHYGTPSYRRTAQRSAEMMLLAERANERERSLTEKHATQTHTHASTETETTPTSSKPFFLYRTKQIEAHRLNARARARTPKTDIRHHARTRDTTTRKAAAAAAVAQPATRHFSNQCGIANTRGGCTSSAICV